MAEVLAFTISEYILPNLISFPVNEIGLIYGCRADLKKLEETLSAIKAVLLDAEEMQEKSHFVKDRIKLLEEVLYDADDLLDYISTEGLRRKLDTRGRIARQVCDFFSPSLNHLAFRHKIGHAIREIRGKLDEIANDISKFNFVREKAIVVGNRIEIRKRERERETDSFVMTSEVIGRDKEKKEIIDMLLGSSGNSHHVSVLPIVGLGGLGKTALAKLVYNDESVVKQFEPRIWVCVSEDFDIKVIIQSILRCITNEKVDDLEMEQLQTRLRKNVDGKKYLLVLDDVWNEDHRRWLQLERLLIVEANSSKIVVTARSSRVASAMGINEPYILNGLTEDQSWKLFESLAFGKGLDKVDSKLVEIGKEIINKCKGVPLAIKTLGSTMRSKIGESEWLSIQNNEIWSLSLEDSGILPVLKLSYDHLPTHLKFCFAYCSIFPKDYKIKYHVLIQLWMAQGYIQSSSQRQDLEYIADHYFRDLLSRSFFQEVEVDDFGNITNFKMHDFIHDLAKEVAGIHCCSISNANDENNYERVRHVSLQVKRWRIPRLLLEEKGMRTFFISSTDWSSINSHQVIAKFRRIRALDLHKCAISKVQGSIGLLKHLRYLDLSNNYFMEHLPNSISNLVNLQTLILSRCWWLKELPRGVTKLINLRYLMIDDCPKLRHMPLGLGKLTSLQMLSKFEVSLSRGCGRLHELSSLKHLRGEIEIKQLEKVRDATSESKQAKLNEKPYLQSLKLHWKKGKWKAVPRNGTEEEEHAELVLEGLQPHSNLKELRIINYRGAKLGSWMMGNVFLSSLPNLVRLTLIDFERCQHLPALDQLSCLKFLHLQRLYAVENIGAVDGASTSFPRLTKLTIIDCPKLISMPLHPHLEEWKLSSVHERLLLRQQCTTMSNLKSLDIAYISDLQYLPDEVLQTSLQALEISYCNKLLRLTASSEEEEEGFRSLTSLRSLHISSCKRLTSLSRSGFQHLTALEKLTIWFCDELDLTDDDGELWNTLGSLRTLIIRSIPKLVTLPEGFQHFTALEDLTIDDCENLKLMDDGFNWQALKSLRRLEVKRIPDLVSLPKGVQHLTTLQHLFVYDCSNFVVVPEWILNLTSLKRLTLNKCSGLTSLPQEMRCLSSLLELSVLGCPDLEKRCKKKEWNKIAHIPNITIDGEAIQGDYVSL